MRIYVVRHAWAEDQDRAACPNDDLRPLSRKGRKRFRRMARKLATRGFDVTRIASSPLVRCRQTADILADYVASDPLIVELDALRPGSQLAPLLEWTRRQDGCDVAWVGHAPDVARLTAALVGGGQTAFEFAKGTVAAIEFAGSPAAGGGVLRWLAVAELLKC